MISDVISEISDVSYALIISKLFGGLAYLSV